MNLNKIDFKKAFDFLVEYSWLLIDTSNYYWCSDGEYGRCNNLPNFDVSAFLTSNNPRKAVEKVRTFISFANRPEFPLKSNSKLKCQKDSPVLDFEIVQWLEESIERATNSTTNKRDLLVLKEYSELLAVYKKAMVEKYNSKSEEEIYSLIKRKPVLISIINNPSFELEKTAWLSNHENSNGGMMNGIKIGNDCDYYNYCARKYNSVVNTLPKREEQRTDDQLVLDLMEINPFFAYMVMCTKVSKETFDKAINHFPELVFFEDCENVMHLVLNETVYDIVESEIKRIVESGTNNTSRLEKPLWAFQVNLALLTNESITQEEYMRTVRILKQIYELKYNHVITNYENEHAPTHSFKGLRPN